MTFQSLHKERRDTTILRCSRLFLFLLIPAFYTRCPECKTLFAIQKTLGEEVASKKEIKSVRDPHTGHKLQDWI